MRNKARMWEKRYKESQNMIREMTKQRETAEKELKVKEVVIAERDQIIDGIKRQLEEQTKLAEQMTSLTGKGDHLKEASQYEVCF